MNNSVFQSQVVEQLNERAYAAELAAKQAARSLDEQSILALEQAAMLPQAHPSGDQVGDLSKALLQFTNKCKKEEEEERAKTESQKSESNAPTPAIGEGGKAQSYISMLVEGQEKSGENSPEKPTDKSDSDSTAPNTGSDTVKSSGELTTSDKSKEEDKKDAITPTSSDKKGDMSMSMEKASPSTEEKKRSYASALLNKETSSEEEEDEWERMPSEKE